MRQKRVRTKLFSVWLHPLEFEFLNRHSDKNLSTASKIIRGWIHEVMKLERYELLEPLNPDKIKKGGRK